MISVGLFIALLISISVNVLLLRKKKQEVIDFFKSIFDFKTEAKSETKKEEANP